MIKCWTDGHYTVLWSEEDRGYVATHSRYPALSWIHRDPREAYEGLNSLIDNFALDLD